MGCLLAVRVQQERNWYREAEPARGVTRRERKNPRTHRRGEEREKYPESKKMGHHSGGLEMLRRLAREEVRRNQREGSHQERCLFFSSLGWGGRVKGHWYAGWHVAEVTMDFVWCYGFAMPIKASCGLAPVLLLFFLCLLGPSGSLWSVVVFASFLSCISCLFVSYATHYSCFPSFPALSNKPPSWFSVFSPFFFIVSFSAGPKKHKELT